MVVIYVVDIVVEVVVELWMVKIVNSHLLTMNVDLFLN